MSSEPRAVWQVQAELGEGPVWVERDQELRFSDINRRQGHRYTPATVEQRSWDAPEQIGFILPREGGGFIAGLQSGLYHFNENDGSFDLLLEAEPDRPGKRLHGGA